MKTLLAVLFMLLPSIAHAEVITAAIQLKERVSLQSLAQSVTDPQSPRYQKFYSPEEIRQLAGPTDAQFNQVVAQLKTQKIAIVKVSNSHLVIMVRADRKVLQGFQQNMRALDTNAAPVKVLGLSPSVKRKPHLRFLTSAPKDFSGFLPAQIQKAYGFDTLYASGLSAKGQNISIATYDSFYVQDVKDYYTKNGVSPAPTVEQVNFNGTAVYNTDSAAETQTDAEFSGMIAHGASIHVYTSAENSDAGELAMFTAIVDNNQSKVVNYSWGSCESQLAADHKTAMDKVFAQAVAQGINIFVASGDSGSDCLQDGSVMADYPASSPNVVAVGGTTLALLPSGLASETAWSGSGGGISTLYAKPSYQSELSATTYPKRAYPDVAFNADPNSGQPTWLHYYDANGNVMKDASYIVIGGTSIAAPQWSGFAALVNAARASKSFDMHGIYLNVSDAQKASCFDDVVSGSNGAFTAAPGWDAVTGWGSMRAAALLKVLKAL
jgi:kumamolisin